MTYGTTPVFLEYFGLRSLEDLPAADELRRIVVQKPEGLSTVDPGLATAPPTELAPGTEPPPAEPTAGQTASREQPAAETTPAAQPEPEQPNSEERPA